MQTATAQTIPISGYTFQGPFTDTDYLRDEAGIYVILDRRGDSKWYVLDVGESGQLRSRVTNHDRQGCWTRNRQGTLGVAAYYTPGWSDEQRRALEAKIRADYNPTCGEQ